MWGPPAQQGAMPVQRKRIYNLAQVPAPTGAVTNTVIPLPPNMLLTNVLQACQTASTGPLWMGALYGDGVTGSPALYLGSGCVRFNSGVVEGDVVEWQGRILTGGQAQIAVDVSNFTGTSTGASVHYLLEEP